MPNDSKTILGGIAGLVTGPISYIQDQANKAQLNYLRCWYDLMSDNTVEGDLIGRSPRQTVAGMYYLNAKYNISRHHVVATDQNLVEITTAINAFTPMLRVFNAAVALTALAGSVRSARQGNPISALFGIAVSWGFGSAELVNERKLSADIQSEYFTRMHLIDRAAEPARWISYTAKYR